MVSIAACLYLPEHVATVSKRAYYYALGDADASNASLRALTDEVIAKVTGTAAASASRASSTAGTVTDTAMTLTNQALESLSSASLAAAKSLGLDSPQHAVEKAKEVVGEL